MLAILSGSILLFVRSLKDEMLSDASDEGDNLPAAIPLLLLFRSKVVALLVQLELSVHFRIGRVDLLLDVQLAFMGPMAEHMDLNADDIELSISVCYLLHELLRPLRLNVQELLCLLRHWFTKRFKRT